MDTSYLISLSLYKHTGTPQPQPAGALDMPLLAEFHCFSKIPIEVRLMIWRNVPKPRVLEVELCPQTDTVSLIRPYI
jgi:hypothetical protein